MILNFFQKLYNLGWYGFKKYLKLRCKYGNFLNIKKAYPDRQSRFLSLFLRVRRCGVVTNGRGVERRGIQQIPRVGGEWHGDGGRVRVHLCLVQTHLTNRWGCDREATWSIRK